MSYYCGIDLHSTNHVVCVNDDEDKRVLEKKLSNDSSAPLIAILSEYKSELKAIAIESTFNWYWLVDDLQAVPTGYICPVELRGLRDLSRKRMSLVQYRTQQILSVKTQYQRSTGHSLSTNELKLKNFQLPVIGDSNVQMAMEANFNIMNALNLQIKILEKRILQQAMPMDNFEFLKNIDGIGVILTWVILLETGDITRFKGPGNYASYCRCVDSRRESNGKAKGENNRKNGNRFLSWAYIEAANHMIRHNKKAQQFFQKKKAKTNQIVALKALSCKIAKGCYHVMSKGVPFDEEKLFA